MKTWIRQLALCSLVGTSSLWGCNSKDPATAVTGQAVIPDREVIAYIPQDTPYLWMGLEALPKAVMEKNSAFSKAMADSMEDGFWDEFGQKGVVAPQIAQLMKEIGNLDASRLQEIGLSPDHRVTVYGLGLLPVVRVEVQDVEKMRALLKRIEAAGDPWPVKKLGDQEYFAFERSKVSMAIAFVKNELVFAMTPAKMTEKLLKIAFLQEKPQNAFKDMSALKALSRDFGLRYSMGYLDNRILGDILMGRAQGLNGEVASVLELVPELPEHCGDEISQLLAKMPRIVAGGTDSTTGNRQVCLVGLELDPSSAKDLSSIANQGFGMGPKGKLVNLAVGLDLPKTVEYLKKQVSAIQAAPFQCRYFSEFNEASAKLGGMLPLLMNPQWMEISAVSAAADQFDMKMDNVSGSAMIAHAHPENLLAFLKVVGLPDLGLKPDGQIVDLQNKLPDLPIPKIKLQARMTQNALGIAAGEGQNLTAFMESKGEPGLILSLGFDMKLLEMARQGLTSYVEATHKMSRRMTIDRLLNEKQAKGEAWTEQDVKERMGEEAFQKLKKAHPEMNSIQLLDEALKLEDAKDVSNAVPVFTTFAEYVGMVQLGVKVTPKGVIGEWTVEMK